MRIIILLIAIVFSHGVNGQAKKSLKVKIENGSILIYPPGTKFEIKNQEGEVQFDQDDLKKNIIIDIEEGEELTVYTTWASGKDVFKPESAYVSLLETVERQDKEKKEKFWEVGRPKIISEKYTANQKGEYDAEIEFEEGIKFTYKMGDVQITENGEPLEIVGKYMAETEQGLLKLSYQAEKKKFYYVFTDETKDSLVIVK